jgi:2'-5' RNA ligase
LRAFLASTLPPALHRELASLVERLDSKVPSGSVRWVNTDNIHLTLKFLGDINPSQSDLLLKTARPLVEARSPFALEATGLGMFPNAKRPTVIWVGVREDDRHLAELHSTLESLLGQVGFEVDSRRFHPHLTLGRTRRGLARHDQRALGEALTTQPVGSLGEWEVRTLVLMRSDLRPEGARYTPVETLQFGEKTG